MTGQSKSGPQAQLRLDSVDHALLSFIAFSLAWMNGSPLHLTSGIYVLAAVAIMWLNRIRRFGLTFAIPRSAVLVTVLWLAWCFIALLSAAANFSLETIANWFWSYFVPWLLLVTLVGLGPSVRDVRSVILWFAIGMTLRYSYAAWVFLSTWGLTDLVTTLNAHFYVGKILPYEIATYGNTGRTAALLATGIVLLASYLFVDRPRPVPVVICAAAIAIMGYNSLIAGSRGLFFSVLVALGFAGLALTRRARGLPIIAALVFGVSYIVQSLDAEVLQRFTSVATGNIAVDTSLRVRADSIQYGIYAMLHNPLGVGPEMSYRSNPYSIAHQFAVSQGEELGVLGFAVVIALCVVIVLKALRLSYGQRNPFAICFWFAAFCWVFHAMTANLALGSGTLIPWAGFLALFVGFGEALLAEPKVAAGSATKVKASRQLFTRTRPNQLHDARRPSKS